MKFAWGKPQKQAFDALKRAVSSPPVLNMVDTGKPLFLQTYVNGVTLQAVCRKKLTVSAKRLRMLRAPLPHKGVRRHRCMNLSVQPYCLVPTNSEST